MGFWDEVDFSKVNPNLDLTPLGEYTFELNAAYMNKYKPDDIDVKATIVAGGDGSAIGRGEYIRFGGTAFGLQQLARLVNALGEEPEEGVHPCVFINGLGAKRPRFVAEVVDRSYVKDGENVTKHAVGLKTIRAAEAA